MSVSLGGVPATTAPVVRPGVTVSQGVGTTAAATADPTESMALTQPSDLGLIKGHKHDGGEAAPSVPPSPAASSLSPFPARVIIIRHGEKPDDPSDPNLTAQGQQRADALATVLPAKYPNITAIFAAKDSKSSSRPVETITPTAQKLGLPINEDYKDKDFAALAQTLTGGQYAGQTVVVAWHHGEIPALTQALGATPPMDKWPSDTFDRIWEVEYNANGQATVQNLPQQALPGDSTS